MAETLSIIIPPKLSSTTTTTLRFPNLVTLFPTTTTSTSLFLHHKLHPQFHIIRCRCSSPAASVLAVDKQDGIDNDNDNDSELSTTRLLAQNVPWTSTAAEIRELFQQYGTVVSVELSMHNKTMNRGLAFVEMGSPEEAAEAYAKLEAFEYGGRILNLTYAKPKKKKAAPPPKPPVVYNLFVANLPFEARAKDLKAFFEEGGTHPVSAEIIFYDNPRKSAGYGFVSFMTKREADEALSGFEGKELLGRPIRIARSNRFVKLETEINPKPEEEEEESSTDSAQVSD